MEPGVFTYFTSNLFWFATSLSLLGVGVIGWKFTGMTDGGKMSQNLNFASTTNKLILAFSFLVLEIVLNLVLVFSSSMM